MRSLLFLLASLLPLAAAETDPLFDWSPWEAYRGTVRHPSGAIQAADLVRARENLLRHDWARAYRASLERTAAAALPQITPEFLVAMIPATTPGDPKFTPCPACRALGKPVHPHGQWTWTPAKPEQLTCEVCRTVFPHPDYPESVVLRTRWGEPQTLTYYGGEPFVVFAFKSGRPSFSGNIRARKVAYAAGLARTFGEAYLLTGNVAYARAARALLLRFAAVYPHWLVHSGYGEYADLDPHVAAAKIQQLPEPELCPPPTLPDRKLHTGYWSAGRASAVGQESHFVRRVVEAYDFTCEAAENGMPVYADSDRRTIERDLLLESTVLLVADKAINNKSVGNRTAAALVGLCVGHPGLVRFGWDGFQQTVDGWFLPDGTTSESPAYATMTLGNIWDMAQALRGYSDPPGFRDADGRRVDAADPYHGTGYERVWRAMFNGLQGDGTYPAYADSYRNTTLGPALVELMTANYPEHAEYRSLLRLAAGDDLRRGSAATALYYRAPDLAAQPAPPLALTDWLGPDLRIGHLRTGADGREGLVQLSASHWGGHHHEDSLNLTYWKQGAEILSDLGYLWDHPQKHQTGRTLAHNTVLIDGKDQRTRERGGEVTRFQSTPHVKLMTARSAAYAEAAMYQRTTIVIDHGQGRSYVVDLFDVQGGQRQDYVFHTTGAVTIQGLALAPTKEAVYDFQHVRTAAGASSWTLTWPTSGRLTAALWSIGQPAERVLVGDGWGQRDWRNSDHGATLPYIVRRTEGPGRRQFRSVVEAYPEQPFIHAVQADGDVLRIATALGTDLVRCDDNVTTLTPLSGAAVLRGHVLVASIQDEKLAWTFSDEQP